MYTASSLTAAIALTIHTVYTVRVMSVIDSFTIKKHVLVNFLYDVEMGTNYHNRVAQ